VKLASTSTNYWHTSTIWRLCHGNCVAKKTKKNLKKLYTI